MLTWVNLTNYIEKLYWDQENPSTTFFSRKRKIFYGASTFSRTTRPGIKPVVFRTPWASCSTVSRAAGRPQPSRPLLTRPSAILSPFLWTKSKLERNYWMFSTTLRWITRISRWTRGYTCWRILIAPISRILWRIDPRYGVYIYISLKSPLPLVNQILTPDVRQIKKI